MAQKSPKIPDQYENHATHLHGRQEDSLLALRSEDDRNRVSGRSSVMASLLLNSIFLG